MKSEILFLFGLASSFAIASPIAECVGGQKVILENNSEICISPTTSTICPEKTSLVALGGTSYCVSLLSSNSKVVESTPEIIPAEPDACLNNTLRVYDSNFNRGMCVQMDKMLSRNFKIYNEFKSSWLQARVNESLAFGDVASIVSISGFIDGNRLHFLFDQNYICLPANGQEQTPLETCWDQSKTIRATRAANGEWFYLSDNSLDESTLQPKSCLSVDWGSTTMEYWRECNENDPSQQFKLVA